MNDRRGATKFALVSIALALGVSARAGLWDTKADAARQEKTLSQTGKNVKVLTDLPESQTFLVMNFVSASLGVRCDHCHVNEGGDKWVWESDAKPEKLTARRMMQMQIDINRGNKDILGTSGVAVTCFTCHRGQTKPANSPVLPIAITQAQLDAGTAKKPATPETLPTVEQILDKYVAAVGGRASVEKLKTRVTKGTQVIWNGTEFPFETYQKAPNKSLDVTTRPNNVVVSVGFDGNVGWLQGPRGVRDLGGAQLAQAVRDADFYGELHLREQYPEMAVAGREKVGERDAYVIVSRVSDRRIERLYFDAQTGLLLRVNALTETPLARLPEETAFEDYREVDGMKIPFTVRASYVDPFIGWTRKLTEVRHNVTVEDSKFDKPAPKK
ncbi:MAG TPA: c-type cytochrome [Pyrinomonadaceae bacterium]|nr:c-type cytochrome [Pyrinomonadaceae bacterium]